MNENWLGLDGQVVIVTGGASGIGKHVVDTLVKVGANAVAVDLNVKTGDELDGAYCVQCNVTDPESVNQMVQAVLEKYGKIDALVNNAGINDIHEIENITDEEIERMIATNLVAPIKLLRGFTGSMKHKKYGRIVNIGSIWAVVSKGGRCVYSATKNGIHGVTNTLAVELAADNILVNTVCPGFTMTELTVKNNTPEEIAQISANIPMQRMARPEEIAEVVYFLCSEQNTYLTGQKITVDGGYIER